MPRSRRSCGRSPTCSPRATRCSRCATRARWPTRCSARSRRSEAPSLALHALDGTLKWPVLAGALLGVGLALAYARRRAAIPLALTASGLVTFAAIAGAGLSVIDRYLAVTALGLLVFAAFAIAGFTVLPDGHPARTPWVAAACVVAVGGAVFTATHLHPGYIDRELTTRRVLRQELARLITTPAFRLANRCGPVTVPNHKLIPDARWILHDDADEVLARSGLPRFGQNAKGVHVFVDRPRHADELHLRSVRPRLARRCDGSRSPARGSS